DRQRRDALAAARLADDRERFSRFDTEAHAVDRAHHAVARVKVRLQVVDVQQRHRHIRRARRGSSASRNPSPSRLTANTVSERKMPGKSRIVPAIWIRLRASAMMFPQLGMLGGVPAPMNERIASVIIADAQI